MRRTRTSEYRCEDALRRVLEGDQPDPDAARVVYHDAMRANDLPLAAMALALMAATREDEARARVIERWWRPRIFPETTDARWPQGHPLLLDTPALEREACWRCVSRAAPPLFLADMRDLLTGYVSVIPAGRFLQGSPGENVLRTTLRKVLPSLAGPTRAEEGRQDDEGPMQPVHITRPFLMARFQVTQALWGEVMDISHSRFDAESLAEIGLGHEDPGQLPIDNMTWFEAALFCNRLSERDGLEPAYTIDNEAGTLGYTGYGTYTADVHVNGLDAQGWRMPTEAEWEYACRAGTRTPTYGPLDDIAWYLYNAQEHPHPVGQKAPNAWGLHDMIGNVAEWCTDGTRTYRRDDVHDPIGSTSTEKVRSRDDARVLFYPRRARRGGDCRGFPEYCRAASRQFGEMATNDQGCGFRLVRALAPFSEP